MKEDQCGKRCIWGGGGESWLQRAALQRLTHVALPFPCQWFPPLVRTQPRSTKAMWRTEPGANSEYLVLIGHKLRHSQGKHLMMIIILSITCQSHAN